ncbi:MAG: alanine dehydrogenase [Flavobacteriales bacterium]|nr:alanine dehydrogenase [Flavobacteriales bacterium]
MITSKDALRSLAQEAALMPQEEMLEVGRRKKQLFIGIPKETSFQENRVALTPEAVKLLTSNGNTILIESEAGKKANFTDTDYSEAGAQIVDVTKVYEADIILKVAPPFKKEIKMMKTHQTLLSALQLTVHPKDTLELLMQKKVTAVAWDFIKDEEGIYPVVRTMGEIAGNTSILIAAEYLSNINEGKGMMFGGIAGVKPSEVIILGAGTVGENAAQAAIGLGAEVKVFDNSIAKLRRLQQIIGHKVYTSTVQPDILTEELRSADVVIGAIRGSKGRTPCIITDEMVQGMKEGAVIVDVSIDRGGCFETSEVTNHDHPVFTKHGVIHYCVPNIASRVSRTASEALSHVFGPLINEMGNEGGCTNYLKNDPGFRNGIYIFKGTLTNETLGKAFNIPFKDLDLLFSAFGA